MSPSEKIDAIVASAIERRVFPGAVVLIARGDRLLHHKAYGATTYEAPPAQVVQRDTIYDIASLTKMFTATAALRLYEAGRLDLHAPVMAYLPEFCLPEINVWHLLTHTSGLDIRLSALRHAGRAGLLEAVYATPLAHPPGTRVAYTNVNSLLLGEIVALRSGAPLDRALAGLVIEPLGLRDTQFRPPPELRPRIAPTEIDEEWRGALVHGSVHDESAHALGGVAGHAGLFSTAGDLHTFCLNWLPAMSEVGLPMLDRPDANHSSDIQHPTSSMLQDKTIALATSNQTPELQVACGLGWMIDRPNFMGAAPAGSFGHTGFTGPAVVVVPQRRLVVSVLSNRVYPRRGQPTHHPITAAIVDAALELAD